VGAGAQSHGAQPADDQWYLQKVDQFLGTAGVGALEDLTALSLKRSIAGERERGLADNTVRASFEVVKGLTL
jgi:hypothetical protein